MARRGWWLGCVGMMALGLGCSRPAAPPTVVPASVPTVVKDPIASPPKAPGKGTPSPAFSVSPASLVLAPNDSGYQLVVKKLRHDAPGAAVSRPPGKQSPKGS